MALMKYYVFPFERNVTILARIIKPNYGIKGTMEGGAVYFKA